MARSVTVPFSPYLDIVIEGNTIVDVLWTFDAILSDMATYTEVVDDGTPHGQAMTIELDAHNYDECPEARAASVLLSDFHLALIEVSRSILVGRTFHPST